MSCKVLFLYLKDVTQRFLGHDDVENGVMMEASRSDPRMGKNSESTELCVDFVRVYESLIDGLVRWWQMSVSECVYACGERKKEKEKKKERARATKKGRV